jgi:RimJ/RimL family protein N-acetyltransferase
MAVELPASSPDLRGDGVLLTPWEQDDLPAILELADDEGRRWSRSLAGMTSVEDARRWLAERSGPDRVDWAVRDPATRALLGRSGLHQFHENPRSAEIGYGVHPAHRRRGVASAAVATVTRWAFEEMTLRRVELIHDVGNTVSCRVATRGGYLLEGVEREALGYPDGTIADLHRHARLVTDPPGPADAAPLPLVVPTLDAEGVRLRPWRDEEAATFARGMSDPEAARWSAVGQPFGTDDARRMLGRFRRRARDGRSVIWAVEEDGVLAGSLGVRGINTTDWFASVAYWVLPELRGRDIAPRALRAATTYAFEVLGLHRLQLQHALGNTASCRVAEKAGFALESLQRGSVLLAEGFVDEHEHVRVRGG